MTSPKKKCPKSKTYQAKDQLKLNFHTPKHPAKAKLPQ